MSPIRQSHPPIPPFSNDRADGGNSKTWLIPVGLVAWADNLATSGFLPLAGGMLGFSHCDVITDYNDALTIARIPAPSLIEAAAKGGIDAENRATQMMKRLTGPRADWAGLVLNRWHIMGIINATPDSFSDGGAYGSSTDAIAMGRAMARAGASIVDIGGESTRPGAEPVSTDEESRRILPIIAALAADGDDGGYAVSADTRHTPVMHSVLASGASIINSVGGLADDGAAALVAEHDASAVIMHMQGTPQTMQDAPQYRYAPTDIFDWLEARLETLCMQGIRRDRLAVDAGIGFGKTPQHNMQILGSLGLYHGLGVPVLLGVSRKASIAHFSRGEPPRERVAGSLALAALAIRQGVQIIRTHDVAKTHQALACATASIACNQG